MKRLITFIPLAVEVGVILTHTERFVIHENLFTTIQIDPWYIVFLAFLLEMNSRIFKWLGTFIHFVFTILLFAFLFGEAIGIVTTLVLYLFNHLIKRK